MTPEFLHECFTYDAETGLLHWKHRPLKHFLTEREWKLVNTRQAEKLAGSERKRNDGKGYLYIKACGKYEAVHRVALIMSGIEIPSGMVVDHINGDRQDNRLCNLRVTTPSGNAMNLKKRSNNTSGQHGIMWRKERSAWAVRLVVDGKTHVCGHFKDIGKAIECRDAALVRLGFSELHGKERGC